MLKASFTPGAAPASDAPLLPRYTLVTLYEEKQVGDWMWYRVGTTGGSKQRKVGVVKPSARPEGVGPTDKWIDMSLFEQTLAAYEGDRMVYATLLVVGVARVGHQHRLVSHLAQGQDNRHEWAEWLSRLLQPRRRAVDDVL